MLASKVTTKGQTTLPAELRTALGLQPGDRVRYIKEEDGSFRIQKLSASFSDLKGMLRLGRPVETEELLSAVDSARAAIGGVDDRS